MRQLVKYLFPVLAAILFASMVLHVSEAQGSNPLPVQKCETVFIGRQHASRILFEKNVFDKTSLICFAFIMAGESGTGTAADSGSKQTSRSVFELPYASDKGEVFPQELSPAPEPSADRTVRYVYALRKIIV